MDGGGGPDGGGTLPGRSGGLVGVSWREGDAAWVASSGRAVGLSGDWVIEHIYARCMIGFGNTVHLSNGDTVVPEQYAYTAPQRARRTTQWCVISDPSPNLVSVTLVAAIHPLRSRIGLRS